MPEQLLKLLYGHTLIYRHCCQRSAELVRVYFWNAQMSAQFP